jgi:hypothetical protein
MQSSTLKYQLPNYHNHVNQNARTKQSLNDLEMTGLGKRVKPHIPSVACDDKIVQYIATRLLAVKTLAIQDFTIRGPSRLERLQRLQRLAGEQHDLKEEK